MVVPLKARKQVTLILNFVFYLDTVNWCYLCNLKKNFLLKPKKKINKEQILKKGKKKNKSVSTLKVLKRELYNLIM